LVLGGLGSGKSQLLLSMQRIAADRGFVTAYVAHDPASRVSFNRPDRIYRRLVETLRLPNEPGAPADPLRTVMDRWADEGLPRLVGTSRSGAIAFRPSSAGLLPRDARGPPPRTAPAPDRVPMA